MDKKSLFILGNIKRKFFRLPSQTQNEKTSKVGERANESPKRERANERTNRVACFFVCITVLKSR